MNQDIVDYVLAAQKHGLTDFEIKQNLLSAGWEAPLVEEGFGFAKAAEGRTEPGRGAEAQAHQHPQQGVFPNAKPGDFNQGPALGPKPLQSLPNVQQPAAQPFQAPQQLAAAAATPLSDQNFSAPAEQPKRFNVKMIASALVTIFVLASGAYGYYAYLYTPSPQTIWQQFLSAKKNPVFKTDFNWAYTDAQVPGPASSTQSLTLSFGGNSSVNLSDPTNPKAGGKFDLGMSSGDGNFSVEMNYLLLNQILYLDIGQIPQLKALLPGQNIEWLKIDFQQLQKYAKDNSTSLGQQDTNLMGQNQELQNKLKAIWQKNALIKTTDFLAKEKINDAPVYHIKNQFDSQAFSQALSDSLDAIENSINASSSMDMDVKVLSQEKGTALAILNKLKVKTFDVWIGQKDHQLYKIQLAFAAPSISDLNSGSLTDAMPVLSIARAKSRDAKRLADIRQMASALELYSNDYEGGYPAGANGVPQGGISPNYIGRIPTAPLPVDGTCTDYYNSYWYQPSGQAKKVKGQTVYSSYSLTFCLGVDTGGYRAGIGQLTPQGITAAIACPSTPDKCVNSSPPSVPDITSIVNQMSFSAELKFDASYSDFGKAQNLQAPDNATDIMQLLSGGGGPVVQTQAPQLTSDETRLRDIRNLAPALEMYFNDKNAYPDSLSQLPPNYIWAVPISPPDNLGVCSPNDAAYTYKKISDSNYSLTFCFGQATGGYSAGKHTLSPGGIQ